MQKLLDAQRREKKEMQTLKPRVQTLGNRLPSLPTPSRSDGYRIRGRRLQAIRHAHFAAHPLCVMCEAAGRVSAATALDHIVALTNGGTDTPGNRQGLCEECHNAKTLRDLRGGV